MKRIGQRYGTVSRIVFVIAIAAGLLALSGGVGTAAAQTAVVEQEGDDAVDELSTTVIEEETTSEVTVQETIEVDEETEEVTDETGASEDISVDPVTPVTPDTPTVPAIDLTGTFDA